MSIIYGDTKPNYMQILPKWNNVPATIIRAGTPLAADGSIANDATAVGILPHTIGKTEFPRPVDLIVNGVLSLPDIEAESGLELTSECKSALDNITFIKSDGSVDVPTGGGGGFKVTFGFDDDVNVTADKTYAEVKAAVEAGELVYGVASVPGLGVGSVICGGYLEDSVIHFVSIGMEVTEDYEQRMVMIWFNCNPDGTFDFNLENPPYKNPLPYVDASDNGKTLKVVDGKWTAWGT